MSGLASRLRAALDAPRTDGSRFVAAERVDLEFLLTELTTARALVGELMDPATCEYTNADRCHVHDLNSRPCPHERARALLAQGGAS